MSDAKKILVVEDEAHLAKGLQFNLEREGYVVSLVDNGESAIELLSEEAFDLMILDIMLPGMMGLDVLREVRRQGTTPVLMLSARGDRADITKGLTLGADDYVTKPFGLEELVLRIKAILRRSQFTVETATNLSSGPITLNSDTHQVTFNGEVVDLSPTEFRLLHVLLESKGRVLSKTYLLDEVWGITFESESTVVDTYISYLRKKLHRDGYEGIKTIRGVGFQLQPEKQ